MGVFEKFLRAGEGRRVKQLAELVPPINALEPRDPRAERRRAPGEDRASSGAASRTARRSTTS